MNTRTSNAGYNAVSEGDSGNITLTAPTINITDSKLYSFSSGSPYDGGDIVLTGANITLDNSELLARKGIAGVDNGNVTINASLSLLIKGGTEINADNVNLWNSNSNIPTLNIGTAKIIAEGQTTIKANQLLTNGSDAKLETSVESSVSGNVNVNANMTGLNVTPALAGSVRTQEEPEVPETPELPENPSQSDDEEFSFADMMIWLFDEEGEEAKKVTEATETAKTATSATSTSESGSDSKKSETGLGIAGAATVNVLSENVSAGISGNVGITAQKIEVLAENKVLDIALAGGVNVQLTQDKNNGFAGAFGVNILDGGTFAYIKTDNKNANTITFENLTVNAERSGQVVSASLSGTGTSSTQGTQIAGNVSVNVLQDDTLVLIDNVNLQKSASASDKGNIEANAVDSTLIVSLGGGIAIGGAVSGGGAAAISGSVATNFIRSQTGAYIENAGLTANYNSGDGVFHALAESKNTIKNIIVNIAVAGTAGVNIIAGVNDIAGITKTIIGNDTSNNVIINADAIDIAANNESDSLGVTITLAGSGVAAVGVAADVHLLSQEVSTKISNSTLTAKNDIDIKAVNLNKVNSNVVGVAGSGIASVNGSISTVMTKGTTLVDLVAANISTTNAGGDINILSNNTTKLKQITGSIAAAGIAGVATSVAVNVIEQEAKIHANSATVLNAINDVNVTGQSEFEIEYLQAHSVGGGLAAVAGTVVVTTLKDKVDVNLGGTINAGNDVNLQALGIFNKKNSHVGGVAGGGVGVAAGIDVLVVNNGVTLLNSAAIEADDIILTAKQTRDINQTTYAASAGGLVGVGLTASVINMGGTVSDSDAFDESIRATNSMLQGQQANTGNRLTTVTTADVANVDTNIKTTALLSVGGSLEANNITGNATVDNKVNQTVVGGALGGFAGVGAAVGVITAKDNIATNINGNITGTEITFNSLAKETEIKQNVIAGGAGLYGLGAGVGVTDISGSVKTNNECR
jgi:hypothetical protein